MSGPDDYPSSPEVQEMVVCDACGKLVPAANVQLHNRACPNRKLPARRNNSQAVQGNQDMVDHHGDASMTTTATAPLEIYDTDTDDSVHYLSPVATRGRALAGAELPDWQHISTDAATLSPLTPSAPMAPSIPIPIVDGYEVFDSPPQSMVPQPQPQQHPFSSSPESSWQRIASGISSVFGQDGSPAVSSNTPTADRSISSSYEFPGARRRLRSGRAIDLTKDDSNAAVAAATTTAATGGTEDDDGASHWPCPRCTLMNHDSRSTCDACHFSKYTGRMQMPTTRSHSARASASPFWDSSPESSPAPMQLRSHARHHDPSPSRSTQSVAIGGALFGGVLGAASAIARGRPVAGAALDGALNGAVGSVMLNEIAQHVERGSNRDTSRRRDTAYNNRGHRNSRQTTADDLLAMHLMDQEIRRAFGGNGRRHGYSASHPRSSGMAFSFGGMPAHGGHVDVSRMSYEELLARFGDGSENRGASTSQLRELPVQTIDDVSKLGEESKDCSICLEEFGCGGDVEVKSAIVEKS